VRIAVQLEPPAAPPAPVEYTWDADTEILSAHLGKRDGGSGMSGSVGLEGSDGSWLVLDVKGGHIQSVEVAVWPDLRRLPALVPPSTIEDAAVVVPARRSQPAVASLEVDTPLSADVDPGERTFHFRLGRAGEGRTVRLANDILLDVDAQSRIAGVWLLNVPPCPQPS
jgi:hypothetical protein